jgi:predicted acyltransferase
MNQPNLTTKPKQRIESIDAFRGFTIFAMIFVIMVAGYRHLPLTFPHFGSVPVSTFKHAGEDDGPGEWALWKEKNPTSKYTYRSAKIEAENVNRRYDVSVLDEKDTPIASFKDVQVWTSKPLHPGEAMVAVYTDSETQPKFQQLGIGCTFTDLVAPFFVFIVGLCIPLSRQKRGAEWWKHVGIRTIGLIIAGIIYISLIFKLSYWWGILQAIGVAYFMGAALMLIPGWSRWIAVFLIAGVHSWLTWHIPWWVEMGDKTKPFWTILTPTGDMLRPLTIHCTPWGSISYGLTTVIGTLLGEAIATRDRLKILKQSLLIGIVFTLVGYLFHKYYLPMNKDFVSASYALFTAGIGAFTFLIFYWLIDVWQFKRGWAWFLGVFGANALLAYFMQPVVRIFLVALGPYEGLKGHAAWNGMLAGLEWTMILWAVVLWFNRKGLYWKL